MIVMRNSEKAFLYLFQHREVQLAKDLREGS